MVAVAYKLQLGLAYAQVSRLSSLALGPKELPKWKTYRIPLLSWCFLQNCSVILWSWHTYRPTPLYRTLLRNFDVISRVLPISVLLWNIVDWELACPRKAKFILKFTTVCNMQGGSTKVRGFVSEHCPRFFKLNHKSVTNDRHYRKCWKM